MGGFLTTDSMMACPHQGQVKATTTNTRVKAEGAPMLRSTDTFVISGCPFMLGPTPHPCVTVNWLETAQRSTVGDPTLTADSLGLCQAADQAVQGVVSILITQDSVQGI